VSEYFLIGEIKSVINRNGFVSIKSYSDFPDKILKLKEVFVDIFGDKRQFIIENI
jgi:ribosomal 30S subunit maturation factor RimM